jgi:hypothetical protein
MNKTDNRSSRNEKIIDVLIFISIFVVYIILRSIFDLEILATAGAIILIGMFLYRIKKRKFNQ